MELNGQPQYPADLLTWKVTLNTKLDEPLQGFEPQIVHPVA
jgi:hypothetical protein